ncbi:MAG: hypothetical protein JO056_05590 [Alphaproteobacteria bacterium]|nr:hypothetical protein [Alphaproteobacteria bacterium]
MKLPNPFRSHLFGGLTDQAVVSFGNFALSLVLAHQLSRQDYGVFSVALSFILFLNLLHQAFITYPLSVRGASADTCRFQYLLTLAILLTPIFALAVLPVLGAALLSVGRLDLLPLASFALVMWQLQEVIRRGMLARTRYRWTIAIDTLRYLGALGAVVAIASWVTISDVFLVLTAASFVSIVAAAPVLRFRFAAARAGLSREIAIHRELGTPVFLANLLLAFSTQWLLWLLAWIKGPAAAALLAALATVAAIASPLIFGAENVIVPEIARSRDKLTFADLCVLLWRRGGVCLLLAAPLILVLMAFPLQVLQGFYGRSSPYVSHPIDLQILAWAYATYLVSAILGAALRGYGAREGIFRMQLYPALFGVVGGTWLTWRYGVSGACTGALCAGLLRAAVGVHYVRELRRVTPCASTKLAVAS